MSNSDRGMRMGGAAGIVDDPRVIDSIVRINGARHVGMFHRVIKSGLGGIQGVLISGIDLYGPECA